VFISLRNPPTPDKDQHKSENYRYKLAEKDSTMDKTIAGLRDQVWTALDQLASGTIGPGQANAVANLSGKLLKSVSIDIDYQRLTGAHRPIAMMEGAAKDDAR
jgi:hypothetical protein